MADKEKNRNIFYLGGSSFFNDMGSEMITPLLPLYITGLGGSGAVVGLVSGLREGLSSLFKILGGWLSDKTGKRKIFVFFGYLLSAIFKFMISLASSWQQVVAFVSLERLGKERDAPRDAIISESSRKEKGKSFSIQQMMDDFGGILGIIILIILLWKFELGFKTIIMTAGIISLLSLFPLIWVKETKNIPINESLESGVRHLDKNLKYFLIVVSVFTLANFGIYMFLILRIKELTGSFVIPLVFYALFSLIYASFVMPFGKLSDKIGRKKVLIFGYILSLIIMINLIFADSFVYTAAMFILYGLVYAATYSTHRALVSDLSGKAKGTAFGSYYSTIGLVSIPAGLIAGLLWDISNSLMFSYLSAITFAALILLFFVKESKYKTVKQIAMEIPAKHL